MKLQEAWRDVIRPTMRREPKTPGNRGVEVVMIDLNGDGIPDPPEPEREDITVTHATTWAAHNNYYIGRRCIATSLPLAVVQTRRSIAGGCSSVMTLIPVG